MPPKEDSWLEYRRLVLSHLERHEEKLDAIEKHVSKLENRMGLLELRSSLFGAIAGGIAAGIAIFFQLISS